MSKGRTMHTRVTRSPRVAASVLRAGGVVAFPTETVYGLGADALREEAVRKIFRAKGRPADNPLIVHIAERAWINRVARRVPPSARRLMEVFFPGPLTVIVPRHADVSLAVTAGLDTVGVRMPEHPVARAFLLAGGTPVAAPSANRSGRPSPTTWRAVADELGGRIPCILQGGASAVGLESTVVDCTVSPPVILREGAVTLEMLRRVVPRVRRSRGHQSGAARSPGMKYKHYAPTARVVLVDGPGDVPAEGRLVSAWIGLTAWTVGRKPVLAATCRGVPAYARALFHFFRVCERRGVKTIYCQRVPRVGLGRALMDRLERAAHDHPTAS